MTEPEIKREILLAFEYSYAHDDWVEPLETVLAGLTAEEAMRRSGPDASSVWAIVLHLAVWNENIVERIATGEKARPAEGAWPSLPEKGDEAAWEAAQTRLWRSLDSVRATVESTPLDTIQTGPYGLADLLCRFVHIGYHLGQIVKMRERTS